MSKLRAAKQPYKQSNDNAELIRSRYFDRPIPQALASLDLIALDQIPTTHKNEQVYLTPSPTNSDDSPNEDTVGSITNQSTISQYANIDVLLQAVCAYLDSWGEKPGVSCFLIWKLLFLRLLITAHRSFVGCPATYLGRWWTKSQSTDLGEWNERNR